MKPLIGFLLIVSGVVLAIPQLYEVLTYLDYEGWPIVQGSLGIGCIAVGLVYLMYRPRKARKGLVEVG